jgi:ABC-type transport system involved in cytochrome bd biosynthesis fused ATPase/permease subunit
VPDSNRPRVEPEIIPPSRTDARWRERMPHDAHNSQRIYVARVGPFGFAMAALAVAIIAALAFLLVLGAFMVLIPIAGLVLAGAVIFSLFRGSFRRRW